MNKIPKIFISYAREDARAVTELTKHLSVLRITGKIDVFSDAEIKPGEDWNKVIKEELNSADIILFLISADFLASDYAYEIELQHALDRHNKGEARVIPVLIRYCNWQDSALGKLQAVPSNGVPIYGSKRENTDAGFSEVVQAIKYAIKDISTTTNIKNSIENANIKGENIIIGDSNIIIGNGNIIINNEGGIQIGDISKYDVTVVFPLSGVPSITFVEPVSFKELISSIRHVGRGLVIEGPSGIGKTTAIKKAIERIKLKEDQYVYLTARDQKNIPKISTVPDWHEGIVIVDDFHRLDEELKKSISDYLKYLADVETSDKKLIIIGISNTGAKLISFGYDLATRIDIFEFGRVSNDKVSALIDKGEKALNINFDKKSDIILASNGSLSIAQFLCHHSSIQDDVFDTQPITKIVYASIPQVIDSVKKVVARKFDNFVFSFSQLGGNRDRTCIKVLKELAYSENGTINLARLQKKKPEMANGISRIMDERQIQNLWKNDEFAKNFLFFDPITFDLVIDDPQLLFYINHTSENVLESISGKKEPQLRDKLFVSYSHKDITYLDRIMVHLKPIFREGIIDVWSDKRINPGDNWNKEIEKALEETKVAILLISADFLASDYITQKELPSFIKANSEEGAMIIPIFLKPTSITKFENITQYQGINSPSKTIVELSEPEQEKLFVKLAERVEEVYKT